MDAMVFFVGAVLVSNIMLSFVPTLSERPQTESACGDTDPAEILRTIMATSLCEPVMLDLGQIHYLDDRITAAESLAVELMALVAGCDAGQLEPLNTLIYNILRAACNPAFKPFLLVVDIEGNQSDPVISIPCEYAATSHAYASSTEIPGPGGKTYLVELILCPALPLELV